MSILHDVLAHAPANWTPLSYSNTAYYEVEVYGEEKNEVLGNFPADVRSLVKSVHRIQNPYMWGNFLLRKEHLLAVGHTLQEATYYHPINKADKDKVMKYNLDCRRYTRKSTTQINIFTKKTRLYSDPKRIINEPALKPLVLVVVKVTKQESDTNVHGGITKDWDTEYYPTESDTNVHGGITKDWDTEYYPQYFVQF